MNDPKKLGDFLARGLRAQRAVDEIVGSKRRATMNRAFVAVGTSNSAPYGLPEPIQFAGSIKGPWVAIAARRTLVDRIVGLAPIAAGSLVVRSGGLEMIIRWTESQWKADGSGYVLRLDQPLNVAAGGTLTLTEAR